MSDIKQLKDLRGVVATVVTTGHVESGYAHALMEMRSWCDRHDMHNIEWRQFDAKLVESGRDAVCEHALKEEYDWLCQIDADAVFDPNTLARMLETAYKLQPDADMVGAYAQLKGKPGLPTIDTGTGRWEPWFPNCGVVEVIRTGGHFFVLKTPVLKRFGPPWFRTRRAIRPIDAMSELDNFVRTHMHGKNPFADTDEWEDLRMLAAQNSEDGESAVGEDSSFCDQLRAVGGKIYVNTDIITGHVAKRVITADDLDDDLRKHEKELNAVAGILTR